MGGHVAIPVVLAAPPFFGRALSFLAGVEVRPAPPAHEIGAVEERRETGRWFGGQSCGTDEEQQAGR
jgi:hypothetical protein